MGRKCSHCGNIGHNSRTCSNYNRLTSSSTNTNFVGNTIRLFGVQLAISSSLALKKSFNMNNLVSSLSISSASCSSSKISNIIDHDKSHDHKAYIGYLSDGLIGQSAQDRKKR